MARMRVPAAQVRRGDRFTVPAELFGRGQERRSGGVTLTVTEVESSERGAVVLHTDRTPLRYRCDEWIYIVRPKPYCIRCGCPHQVGRCGRDDST